MLRIFFVIALLAAASATVLASFITNGNLEGTTPVVGAAGGVWSQQSPTTTGRPSEGNA